MEILHQNSNTHSTGRTNVLLILLCEAEFGDISNCCWYTSKSEMVVLACPVSGCQYKTDDLDPSVIVVLLQLHASDHPSTNAHASGPKLTRPSIDIGVSQDAWNAFTRR